LDGHRFAAAAHADDGRRPPRTPLEILGEEVDRRQRREQLLNVKKAHTKHEAAPDARSFSLVVRHGARRIIEELIDVADVAVAALVHHLPIRDRG
jgi:hypothetical protein